MYRQAVSINMPRYRGLRPRLSESEGIVRLFAAFALNRLSVLQVVFMMPIPNLS